MLIREMENALTVENASVSSVRSVSSSKEFRKIQKLEFSKEQEFFENIKAFFMALDINNNLLVFKGNLFQNLILISLLSLAVFLKVCVHDSIR